MNAFPQSGPGSNSRTNCDHLREGYHPGIAWKNLSKVSKWRPPSESYPGALTLQSSILCVRCIEIKFQCLVVTFEFVSKQVKILHSLNSRSFFGARFIASTLSDQKQRYVLRPNRHNPASLLDESRDSSVHSCFRSIQRGNGHP